MVDKMPAEDTETLKPRVEEPENAFQKVLEQRGEFEHTLIMWGNPLKVQKEEPDDAVRVLKDMEMTNSSLSNETCQGNQDCEDVLGKLNDYETQALDSQIQRSQEERDQLLKVLKSQIDRLEREECLREKNGKLKGEITALKSDADVLKRRKIELRQQLAVAERKNEELQSINDGLTAEADMSKRREAELIQRLETVERNNKLQLIKDRLAAGAVTQQVGTRTKWQSLMPPKVNLHPNL